MTEPGYQIVARQSRPVEGWGTTEHIAWIRTGEQLVRVEWENPEEVNFDAGFDGLATYNPDQLGELIAEYEAQGFVTE